MTPPLTPVVFDTVTLLQAGGNSQGPAGECLRLIMTEKLALFMSLDGLQELHDVLAREDIFSRFPLLTGENIDTFLDGLRGQARIVLNVPAIFHYARDPDDEHILNLAIACKAQFLVTHDNDLLDLMKEENADGRIFRAQAPQLAVVRPPDFLVAVRAATATKDA